MPLVECAERLKQLQKHLKAFIKKRKPGPWKCVKLGQEGEVNFHRIDVERASQCLMLVVHSFPTGDAAALDACGMVAQKNGYYYDFLCFDKPGFNCQWIKKEQVGSSSASWEQTAEGVAADPDLWRNCWRDAAEQLGILDSLREVDVAGLSYPEVIDSVPSTINHDYGRTTQRVEDLAGMKMVLVRYPDPKLTIWLETSEPARARTLWSKGAVAAQARLGPMKRRFMTLEYNGKDRAASERLNEILPLFHLVQYILWDNEKDKIYRQMLGPLTLPNGATRAFPAIAVADDDLGEKPHLIVNVVRSQTECWLEFQTDRPETFFSEIQHVLGGALEVWTEKAECRWNW